MNIVQWIVGAQSLPGKTVGLIILQWAIGKTLHGMQVP